MTNAFNILLRVCLIALTVIAILFGRTNAATTLDVFVAASLVLGILESDKLKNLP